MFKLMYTDPYTSYFRVGGGGGGGGGGGWRHNRYEPNHFVYKAVSRQRASRAELAVDYSQAELAVDYSQPNKTPQP